MVSELRRIEWYSRHETWQEKRHTDIKRVSCVYVKIKCVTKERTSQDTERTAAFPNNK